MPAGVVCPRALPVQTRAWPCSAGPNLRVRCLAPAIGSAHGLAIQRRTRALPSCPYPPPSSSPCTARLWTSPFLKWPPLDPTSARHLPQGVALGTHRLGVQITAHSHTLDSSPELRSPARAARAALLHSLPSLLARSLDPPPLSSPDSSLSCRAAAPHAPIPTPRTFALAAGVIVPECLTVTQ
jgi:hypothetical protein